jgi:hypothetical protein
LVTTFDSPLAAELLVVGYHLGQTVEGDWGPCHSLRWGQEEALQMGQALGSLHLRLVVAEMVGLGSVVEEVVEGRVQDTGPPWAHGDHEGDSGGEVVVAVGDPNPGPGTVLFDALTWGSEERLEEVG